MLFKWFRIHLIITRWLNCVEKFSSYELRIRRKYQRPGSTERDRGIVSPTSKDCQTVTNAIVNAPELPERQQNKIFLKQVSKNELQLATYNNLWTCFICIFMKDKAFLEIQMNNLNNIKLVFATTLCSYFLQWILCSLYLYVCADVCLIVHVLLIPDGCTGHNVSLQEFGE